MSKKCEICGTAVGEDLFAFVTGDPVCSICKLRHVGGLPTTPERVQQARDRLGLGPGEYLKQDNAAEARDILGRR